MYVRGKGIEFAEVARIVREVSEKGYEGNVTVHQDAKPIGSGRDNGYGYQGRIWVESSRGKGARRSASGRRMRAACWHASRDVMRAIFAHYPHAVITTAMARYEGAAGFENTYPGTADVNIGSQASPAYMPELCECDDCE